jgi:hypothetical protein
MRRPNRMLADESHFIDFSESRVFVTRENLVIAVDSIFAVCRFPSDGADQLV